MELTLRAVCRVDRCGSVLGRSARLTAGPLSACPPLGHLPSSVPAGPHRCSLDGISFGICVSTITFYLFERKTLRWQP